MFKNIKFLYAVIAVLLVFCIFCAMHIAKDFSMMYKSREHLFNSFAVDLAELADWSGKLLDSETDKTTFNISFAQVKINLQEISNHFQYLNPPYSSYNIFLKEKQFQHYLFYYDFKGYYTDIELMEKRYEENGKLAEEDLLYIKTLHDSTETMLLKLLDENIDDEYFFNVKKEYFRKDNLFSALCKEFDEKMNEVAIR